MPIGKVYNGAAVVEPGVTPVYSFKAGYDREVIIHAITHSGSAQLELYDSVTDKSVIAARHVGAGVWNKVVLHCSDTCYYRITTLGTGTDPITITYSGVVSFEGPQFREAIIYKGLDFMFSRPSGLDVPNATMRDTVTPELTFAREYYDGNFLFNANKEEYFGGFTYYTAALTKWAVEGYRGNPTGGAFNIDNVHNLFFNPWERSFVGYAEDLIGKKQIVQITPTNTFFEFALDSIANAYYYDGAIQYHRSNTAEEHRSVPLPPRDLLPGWSIHRPYVHDSDPAYANDPSYSVRVSDPVCKGLVLMPNNDNLINSYTEYSWNTINSPVETGWAFAGLTGNSPDESAMTLDNLNSLTFSKLYSAYESYSPNMFGRLALVHAEKADMYFYFKTTIWDQDGNRITNHEYMRSEPFPLVPAGWTLFKKPESVPNDAVEARDVICPEFTLAIAAPGASPDPYNLVSEVSASNDSNSPIDTLWAFLGLRANLGLLTDFTIEKAGTLAFEDWRRATDYNGGNNVVGRKGIGKIISTNKYFYFNVHEWSSDRWPLLSVIYTRSPLLDGPPAPSWVNVNAAIAPVPFDIVGYGNVVKPLFTPATAATFFGVNGSMDALRITFTGADVGVNIQINCNSGSTICATINGVPSFVEGNGNQYGFTLDLAARDLMLTTNSFISITNANSGVTLTVSNLDIEWIPEGFIWD